MENLFKVVLQSNQQHEEIEETIAGIAYYFENLSTEWREELRYEAELFGLDNKIYYDTISPVNLEQAKINPQNTIHIGKSFLLLMWVLCREIPKALDNRLIQELEERKLQNQVSKTIQLYLIRLKSKIKVIDQEKEIYQFRKPRFDKLNELVLFNSEDLHSKELFYNAVCFILIHEVHHHIKDHTTQKAKSVEEFIEREMNADQKAIEVMINAFGEAIFEGDKVKARQIFLGSILGISTLLYIEGVWSLPLYPDTDLRLATVLKQFEETIVQLMGTETRNFLEKLSDRDMANKALETIKEISTDMPEFWKIGITILEIWAKVYKIDISAYLVNSYSEDGFQKLAGFIKGNQLSLLNKSG